jgi:hypothetical protein
MEEKSDGKRNMKYFLCKLSIYLKGKLHRQLFTPSISLPKGKSRPGGNSINILKCI